MKAKLCILSLSSEYLVKEYSELFKSKSMAKKDISSASFNNSIKYVNSKMILSLT